MVMEAGSEMSLPFSFDGYMLWSSESTQNSNILPCCDTNQALKTDQSGVSTGKPNRLLYRNFSNFSCSNKSTHLRHRNPPHQVVSTVSSYVLLSPRSIYGLYGLKLLVSPYHLKCNLSNQQRNVFSLS